MIHKKNEERLEGWRGLDLQVLILKMEVKGP